MKERDVKDAHARTRTVNIQRHIKTRDEQHRRLADEKPRGKKRRLLSEKKKRTEKKQQKKQRPQSHT